MKLLLVCGLALLMSIPALMVFGVLQDRTSRSEGVSNEIGQLFGGQQTFLGPVVAVPYRLAQNADGEADTTGVWIVYPEQGEANIDATTEVRRRSLFRATVYEADIDYTAQFDLSEAGAEAPAGATLDWSRAELLLGASDARGARDGLTLSVGDSDPVALNPSLLVSSTTLTSTNEPSGRTSDAIANQQITIFSTQLGPVDRAAGPFNVTGHARFSGAQQLSVLAFAKSTQVQITGDWPHPSYVGAFLPTEHGPGEANGFTAQWNVPFVARGVAAEGLSGVLGQLGATDLTVRFVESANPYQSVSRSLKYAPMFIGLVFLAFFIFETTNRKRVHAAQYILIGLAQVIFYMLLLAIAEHTGFDIAFALAATATVALISAYAGWTFESRGQGLRALIGFSLLYGLIYVLMRLEDYALLVGALASFGAIAAAMWFTRNINWYGDDDGQNSDATGTNPT